MIPRAPTPVRAALSFLLLCAAVLSIGGAAGGQEPRRWSQHQLQEWLKAVHEKVVKDTDRIVVLARNLRHEVEEKPEDLISPALRERVRALDTKAKRLQEAVEEADENVLSIPVVKSAEEVRDQARSLRRNFELHPARRQLERYWQFCREIEQRAEAVRKRTGNP